VLVDHDVDPRQVAGLASTRTYPLTSSFRPSYNMAVNLVGQFGREKTRELLEQSFAQFQADRSVVGLATQIRKAEGEKEAAVLRAQGQAEARLAMAEAEAEALRRIAAALPDGQAAVYLLGQKYLEAIPKLAEGKGQTVFLPAEATGVMGAVGALREMLKGAGGGAGGSSTVGNYDRRAGAGAAAGARALTDGSVSESTT
jgi:hypothetical protein